MSVISRSRYLRLSSLAFMACITAATMVTTAAGAKANQEWYPLPVLSWDQPHEADSSRSPVEYKPLEKAEKKWKICVSFPHIKDSFWLAADYGVVMEARRLGIELVLYEAGGYDNQPLQLEQIRDCIAAGTDGVIIAGISTDGVSDLIAELKDKNIPTVDLINGMNSRDLTAKSIYSHFDMGYMVGKYIAENHKNGTARVAWFPGPKGAGWVDFSNDGFLKAVDEFGIEVVTTLYGDTGIRAQTELLNQFFATGEAIDYIAGTAITAEAAIPMLRKKKLTKTTKLVTQYFTPKVYDGLKRRRIAAAVSLSTVIQSRIAVDQMVRILENKPYITHVGQQLRVISAQGLKDFDRNTTLAPKGFKTIYTVN